MDMRLVSGFLNELTELTKKYGIEICGCGCCGSPFLDDFDGSQKHYIVTFTHYKDEYDNLELVPDDVESTNIRTKTFGDK